MEYKITITQNGDGWYRGYTDGKYIENSCAVTKLGCKHKIKKKLKHKNRESEVETYILKI